MSDYGTEWRAAAACLSADPEVFFPVAASSFAVKDVAKALQVCGRCRVRQECLDFAIRTGEMHGIWGGTTPEERTRARRQLARDRRSRRAWQVIPAARAS